MDDDNSMINLMESVSMDDNTIGKQFNSNKNIKGKNSNTD
jgi:hypothetical protein